jgi:UDPglucose 6-dehydrogenase
MRELGIEYHAIGRQPAQSEAAVASLASAATAAAL